jgi:hypothetical protein
VEVASSAGSASGLAIDFCESALFKQEAAESAKIVENPAAGSHLSFQFPQIEGNELQCLLAAVGAIGGGKCDIGFDFGEGQGYGFREEGDVFMGAFDVVERGLGAMAHLSISAKKNLW